LAVSGPQQETTGRGEETAVRESRAVRRKGEKVEETMVLCLKSEAFKRRGKKGGRSWKDEIADDGVRVDKRKGLNSLKRGEPLGWGIPVF